MGKVVRLALGLLLLPVLLMGSAGCSLVGFGIGAAIDASHPDEYFMGPRAPDSISPGTTVDIVQLDSSVVSGEYLGVDPLPEQTYSVSYGHYRSTSPLRLALPALGDSLCVVTRSTARHGRVEGLFQGFSAGAVRIYLKGLRQTATVDLDLIDSLVHGEIAIVNMDTLRRELASGTLPVLTPAVLVQQEQERLSIPLGSIRGICTRYARPWRYILGGAGLMCDIILAFALSQW